MSEDNVDQAVINKQAVRKKKFGPRFVTALFFVLVVGLVASLAFGFMYAGVKKPNQNVIVQTPVCAAEDAVKKLNGYLSDITNNGTQDKAKEAITYITSQSDYDSDPTCVEALARFYYIDRDFMNFAGQIDKLESLANEGQYPSPRFDGLSSLASKAIDYESLTGRSR